LSIPVPTWARTTALTGKKASADGSVMVSHSDDGLSDARLIYVPVMNHKPGSLRPVFCAHNRQISINMPAGLPSAFKNVKGWNP
jgi:dipeptidase